jgi:hypothetical protein
MFRDEKKMDGWKKTFVAVCRCSGESLFAEIESVVLLCDHRWFDIPRLTKADDWD